MNFRNIPRYLSWKSLGRDRDIPSMATYWDTLEKDFGFHWTRLVGRIGSGQSVHNIRALVRDIDSDTMEVAYATVNCGSLRWGSSSRITDEPTVTCKRCNRES